ncbi:MAG: CoB--CoM heterodisulfide reductase iron-sulfur subunit A family protein, partial [Deltaproteobacteria bacterium]|nr:CoB--CoM heterodisulfide reductase iron-sulfur subunit A family protein [Deltaproteobacteria bacterium]
MAEVQGISGDPGNFQVKVLKVPRYIDEEKCIGCGICAQKCPKKVKNEFNELMDKRKAVYVPFAQTVPLKYTIDRKACIYFAKGVDVGKKPKCSACQKFCEQDAVDFDQQETHIDLDVGAIILAPGFKCFDPSKFDSYQYSSFKNVVTSLEFERILAATGPTEGHLQRPSDKEEPKKIAWFQCVGSRDMNRCDNPYCSAVCCMYAVKEAMIAMEHAHEPLDAAVFFMDMRTYGKDFEKYYERAKGAGMRFIRCRVHSVEENEDKSLMIRYVDEQGDVVKEDFDMVVLSVGFEPSESAIGLADIAGIELDDYKFAKTSAFTPVATSKPGIYVAGCFQGPKDIPYSVMEASAAAAVASTDLASARGSLEKIKEYPAEKDVAEEEPRIGVFVCNCGINIGSVVKVPEVVEYAKTLPNVVYTQENLFSCSQDTQEKMSEIIEEQGLNRFVVAACSPRTHEPLFQETMVNAGMNKHLFEMANIRDQDSWVHNTEPEAATEKAKDLVRMAVAKANLRTPLTPMELPLTKSALVVGGGPAGMTAALTIADQGFKAHIVEKKNQLGGHGVKLRKAFSGEPVKPFLDDLISKVERHENIDVHLEAELQAAKGYIGNFETTLTTGTNIDHGVTIIATGGDSAKVNEYLYGENPNVMKWFDLDKKIEEDPDAIKNAKCAVAIHCVGSRDPDHPYCSKICCAHAIECAIDMKELNPDLDVYMLYRDVRTYGKLEDLYKKARSLGILFIRYGLKDKPKVEEVDGKLQVTVTDHVLGRPIVL